MYLTLQGISRRQIVVEQAKHLGRSCLRPETPWPPPAALAPPPPPPPPASSPPSRPSTTPSCRRCRLRRRRRRRRRRRSSRARRKRRRTRRGSCWTSDTGGWPRTSLARRRRPGGIVKRDRSFNYSEFNGRFDGDETKTGDTSQLLLV